MLLITIAGSVLGCAAGALLLWGAGWLVARFLLRLEDGAWLNPLAPVCGAALACVWLNGMGRLTGWTAAAATFALLGACGLTRAWQDRTRSPALTRSDRSQSRMAWGLFVVLVAINLLGVLYDEHWHFSLAGLIANGNWPAQYPFNPTLTLSYHYGFDLVVAFLAWFGAPVPLASDVLTALLQMSLVLLMVQFARGIGLGTARAWVAAGCAAVTAGMAWVLRPFRSTLPLELATVQPLHGSLANALLLVAQTKSLLIAATSIVAILALARAGVAWYRGWRGAVAILLFLAAAALSSETIVAAFVPALALAYLCADGVRSRAWRVGVLAVGVLILSVQGGLLTDLVMSTMGFGTVDQAQSTGISVFWSADHGTFASDVIRLGTPAGFIRLLAELGGFLVLLGFALFAWKRWTRLERALLVSAVVTMLLPLVVHYGVKDQETLRFLTGSFLVTNTLGAVALVTMVRTRAVLALLLFVCVLGGLGDWTLSNIPVTWRAEWYLRPTSRALWMPYLRKETALPPGSVVWTDVVLREGPRDARLDDIPLVFGAYAQSCLGIANRIVQEDCGAFLTSPSTDTLAALGATHLLLSDGFIERHKADEWFRALTPIVRYPDDIPEAVGLFWQGKPGALSLYATHTP